MDKGLKWNDEVASKYHRGFVLVDAESWNSWIGRTLPLTDTLPILKPSNRNYEPPNGVSVGKDKRFVVREFPPRTRHFWFGVPCGEGRSSLETFGHGKKGSVSFTDAVMVPVLAKANDLDVVMSLTPMEIWSNATGVRKAKGKVLIGGLGLGYLSRKVLEKKNVTHVTVVDIDGDVLQVFGQDLIRDFGSRVNLVNSDIYDMKTAEYDTVLVDIWMSSGGKTWDKKFKKLCEEHPRVWGWGQND